MSDLKTQLERDIQYYAKDFGELGRYIRIDDLYNILDRYEIHADHSGITQMNRVRRIQKILYDPTHPDERSVLKALYSCIGPP